MKEVILEKLAAIEAQYQVKILYACESGSRAWGFASPDSDYDVRFIFTRSINSYLSIAEKRDVIELPVNEVLDISGWDIRKALQLFLKSNAPLYEWLQSPIVYKEQDGFSNVLRGAMSEYFSGRAGCHHYLSMANNIFEGELQLEEVRLKKYFYVLRPALACLWIIKNGGVPPMTFKKLRNLIQDEVLQQALDDLLEKKRVSGEKALVPHIPLINNWLSETLSSCKTAANELPAIKNTTAYLDELFRKYIQNDI